MPKMNQVPKGRVTHMFFNFFHRFTLKKAFLTASFLILSFALAASCSKKPSNNKTPQENKTEDTTKKTPDPAPERVVPKDPADEKDEEVDPETVSFNLSNSAFLFHNKDNDLKLKTDATSKIITLKFIGGFEEDEDGKVITTLFKNHGDDANDTDDDEYHTLLQGEDCDDKHGSRISDAQFNGENTAVLTAEEQKFARAPVSNGDTRDAPPDTSGTSTAKGVSECYKQIALPHNAPTAAAGATAVLKTALTVPNARPTAATAATANTIVAVGLPTNHAKNSDARIGNCKAVITTSTTDDDDSNTLHTLKAKVTVNNNKLQIQFWEGTTKSGSVDTGATNAAGLAKIKKALGLKTYTKDDVLETIPEEKLGPLDITKGTESMPFDADGDCFKFLYAHQHRVQDYSLKQESADNADRWLPPDEELPSNATISAQKTLISHSEDDGTTKNNAQPSDNSFFSKPYIEISVSGKTDKVKLSTAALEYLLHSINPNIFNFAGGSSRPQFLTAMEELAKLLELTVEE